MDNSYFQQKMAAIGAIEEQTGFSVQAVNFVGSLIEQIPEGQYNIVLRSTDTETSHEAVKAVLRFDKTSEGFKTSNGRAIEHLYLQLSEVFRKDLHADLSLIAFEGHTEDGNPIQVVQEWGFRDGFVSAKNSPEDIPPGTINTDSEGVVRKFIPAFAFDFYDTDNFKLFIRRE